jgi:hypothetical protein
MVYVFWPLDPHHQERRFFPCGNSASQFFALYHRYTWLIVSLVISPYVVRICIRTALCNHFCPYGDIQTIPCHPLRPYYMWHATMVVEKKYQIIIASPSDNFTFFDCDYDPSYHRDTHTSSSLRPHYQ